MAKALQQPADASASSAAKPKAKARATALPSGLWGTSSAEEPIKVEHIARQLQRVAGLPTDGPIDDALLPGFTQVAATCRAHLQDWSLHRRQEHTYAAREGVRAE